MSEHLEAFETQLRAGEELRDGRLVPDEAAIRIYRLTTSYLQQVAVTDAGWSVLYRDPEDGRLWEHTYPESSLQGGGPALLHVISDQEAQARYAYSRE
ncbi:MAG: Imm27 family immunity protein [Gemmatimonadaceae bacterium]